MAIIDSVKLPDNSTYEVADNHSGYQKETLTTPITINGTQKTTVEGALGGLNNYENALKTAISNENLLDNPFFTVNQRGFSSGTVSELNLKACVDRWYITYGTSGTQTVTLGSSGLAFDVAASDYISLYQTYGKMLLKTNEKFTFSVMLADGTIHSITGTWANLTDTWVVTSDIDFVIVTELSRYAIKVKADLTVKAVKLELGTISTLANDVAPNYALELAKCQTSTADPSDTYANQGQLMTSALQGVLGAKNLNSYPYYGNKVENGITWTVNSDGSVTVSGIATGTAYIELHNRLPHIPNTCILKAGTYILSGGISSKVSISIDQRDSGGSYTPIGTDTGSGLTFTIVSDVEFYNAARIGLTLVVDSGTDLSTPVTIYPMIRDARILDPTFAPYAETNLQLTQNKAERNDLSTIHATGSTNTTGAQINAGTFFYLNGQFCKATADIAVNATFTLNTNFKVDTVGKETENLNNSLVKKESYTSFQSAAGNTATTGMPYIADNIIKPDIANYTNGQAFNLSNGGAAFQGIVFKLSDNFWTLLVCGYAEGGILSTYTYYNGAYIFNLIGRISANY